MGFSKEHVTQTSVLCAYRTAPYTRNASHNCVTTSDNPFGVQWDFSEVKGRVVPQWPTRIAAKEVGTSRRDRNVAEGEGRETDCGRIGITKVVSDRKFLYKWYELWLENS